MPNKVNAARPFIAGAYLGRTVARQCICGVGDIYIIGLSIFSIAAEFGSGPHGPGRISTTMADCADLGDWIGETGAIRNATAAG